jgi:ketosteroid isomerase-like protein
MGHPERIALVRRFYAAGPADDDSARSEFAEPDIVWHVPGENPVSGRYQGFQEVFNEIGRRMQPLDVWTVDVTQVMANEDLVVGVVEVAARRGSHHIVSRGAHVFRFSDRGLIAEVWGFLENQAGLDDLLSAPG